jgi:glycosyltransferase involved in cell wall biosynthesis
MNILVINYEYPPIGGGGGVLCKDISEGIASKGHRITVVTSHYDSLQKSQNLHGVNIFRVPVLMRKKQTVASMASMISFVPMCIWKVKELMKCNTYDLINTHFAIPSGPAGQYLSRKYNIPNVLTILGGDIIDPSKFLSPHNTFLLNQTVRKMLFGAARVVAESTDIKRNAQKYYGFDRQVDIVPLGIYPNAHPVKNRQSLGLPMDKFIFVTIGRLVKRKNLEDLLHIIKDVQVTIPSILLIIGDGPEKDNIGKLSKQLGITNAVRLLGRVSDEEKFQYLAASDVYLSTAIHEGFGIVFLEAMECGLPVISYDRGGQTDFLREGKTGYLIELGNKGDFALKLKGLLNSNPLRMDICAHNKNYVKEFYIEHVAEKYISIFNEVASSHKT